jgi:hypothetical protein
MSSIRLLFLSLNPKCPERLRDLGLCKSPMHLSTLIILRACFVLLTGQSVPIFRCGRKRRFHADRHALNDQWHYASRSEFLRQPGAAQSGLPWIQLSGAPCVAFVAFLSCTNPRVGHGDGRLKSNMNTLAQAEVRRNRLKNNTTRLSPAPDRAICNCWHKRKLAGYRPVGTS